MSRFRRSFTLAVVVGLVGFGGVFAQDSGSSAPAPLTGQDHEEIKQLYARYNQGSDFQDTELWLSAFADDAVFRSGGQEYVGQDALRANRAERFQGQVGDNGRRHYNSSFILTPTVDGAQGRAYWLVLDVSRRPPTPVVSGYYDDEFTRTRDGWRIKSRTLHSDAVR